MSVQYMSSLQNQIYLIFKQLLFIITYHWTGANIVWKLSFVAESHIDTL